MNSRLKPILISLAYMLGILLAVLGFMVALDYLL